MLTLANGAIIHVKNAEEVMERITVRFITHLPQNQNIFKLSSSSVPVSVQPTQTIYSLIN
jgi:ABC-type sulfate/molybdate transport systems ATPase subunit